MNKTPVICLWDLETSGAVVSTWNLYPDSIPHQNILQDWYIICGAWKFLGKKPTKAVSVLQDPERFATDHRDDYHVVKTLRDVLENVDILVGHNGDRFDLRMFNARLIYHKLPPLPKIITIDTLKEAKKVAKFTSNRLDYLGDFLGSGGKQNTSPGLWLRAQSGDKGAIREMVKYNKTDVEILEELYLRLRPYMKTHPNLSPPEERSCPRCGSTHTIVNKIRTRASGSRYRTYQCRSCGGYFSDTKNLILPKVKI